MLVKMSLVKVNSFAYEFIVSFKGSYNKNYYYFILV